MQYHTLMPFHMICSSGAEQGRAAAYNTVLHAVTEYICAFTLYLCMYHNVTCHTTPHHTTAYHSIICHIIHCCTELRCIILQMRTGVLNQVALRYMTYHMAMLYHMFYCNENVLSHTILFMFITCHLILDRIFKTYSLLVVYSWLLGSPSANFPSVSDYL